MISSITDSKFTPPRERDDLEGTEEIVPYGGSTGRIIGARKIRELAELLAKFRRRGDTRTGDNLMNLDIPSFITLTLTTDLDRSIDDLN